MGIRGDALVIMVKTPRPGSVKTRLVPPLSYKEAAGLYRCFLKDIFNSVLKLKGLSIYAAYAPEGGKEIIGLIPEGIKAFPQEGRGLGKRISNVFKTLFDKGHKNITVIGSDSPDLPRNYIKEAFSRLDNRVKVVLGPAKDGGYYLIAMNEFNAGLFTGIPWSTRDVLEETIKKARVNSITLKLLKPWHDVDIADDIHYLKKSRSTPFSSEFLRTLNLSCKP